MIDPDLTNSYWVFVCNPKKWAIDRFLDRRVEYDDWRIRPADRDRFAPGQLGVIRVGVDRRTKAERNGERPMEPGVYALCEVESEPFKEIIASDKFWGPGEEPKPGWAVEIRYLRTYLDDPLTIKRLRAERPQMSGHLLNGLQASSFPISANDFRDVMALLGEELDDLPSPTKQPEVTVDKLAAMEQRYLHASPEVKDDLAEPLSADPSAPCWSRPPGLSAKYVRRSVSIPPGS